MRAVIVIANLSSFNALFMSSALNVALPSIGREFQMDPILQGWVNTSFLLAIAPFLIPFGKLGDLYGRKKIFLAGLYVLAASFLLITLSPSGSIIIACRALQGFACAMMYANMVPILITAVPLSERGHALGVVTATTYLGFAAGPFLGGIITYHLGWRFIFWLLFLVTLIPIMLTHLRFESDRRAGQWEMFDLTGAIILGGGLLTAMLGFSTLPDLSGALLMAGGILCLLYFGYFERHASYPIVNMDLFLHNSVFAFSVIAALISYAATFAVSFLLSLYLQNIKSLTPQFTGVILLAQPLVQAFFSPLAGRLSDRMEPRLLASGGMVCTFLGLIMLLFLGNDSSLTYVLLCLVMQGLGFALFSSPNTNAIVSSVERDAFGVASATLSTMRQVGMTLSMGIVMLAMSLFLGKAEIIPGDSGQFLNCMRVSFGIFALLCLGGIFASLARGNLKQ